MKTHKLITTLDLIYDATDWAMRKTKMDCSYFNSYMEQDNITTNVLCTIEFTIENDGIGHYEFWGSKGYDAGVDYAVINSIRWNRIAFPILINTLLDVYINECIDEITDKLQDELINSISANDEPDPDSNRN
jgi:hypothetical protein